MVPRGVATSCLRKRPHCERAITLTSALQAESRGQKARRPETRSQREPPPAAGAEAAKSPQAPVASSCSTLIAGRPWVKAGKLHDRPITACQRSSAAGRGTCPYADGSGSPEVARLCRDSFSLARRAGPPLLIRSAHGDRENKRPPGSSLPAGAQDATGQTVVFQVLRALPLRPVTVVTGLEPGEHMCHSLCTGLPRTRTPSGGERVSGDPGEPEIH